MKQKTHDEFICECAVKFPHIEVLDHYKNSKSIMKFRCKIHDYIFEKKVHDFVHSKWGCRKCANQSIGDNFRNSKEWFREELKRSNPHVRQVGEYVGYDYKLDVVCVYCGRLFSSKTQDLLNGHGCKICADKRGAEKNTKDNEWFLANFNKYNVHKNDIEIISEYTGIYGNVKCKCKICSNPWETKASNLINKKGGSGCPICHLSKGETYIFNYLNEKNIYFEGQKSFDDLVGKTGRNLTYDFFIPSQNLLIELNGLQHYEPVDFFGGIDKFERQKYNDDKKRLYAKNNGYRLLEIDYRDQSKFKDIEKTLQTEIQ